MQQLAALLALTRAGHLRAMPTMTRYPILAALRERAGLKSKAGEHIE